jgi:GT2 family glycosyltransferase
MTAEQCQTDIIIVSYNSRRYLSNCIRSIIDHTLPQPYQIWAVDNASTDGSRELLQAHRQVKTIYNRTNRGYGSACNQGITAGQGEYIFLLNSDLQVTPNWLPPLIQLLATQPQTAVVGPKLVNPDGYIVSAGVIGANAHPANRGWGQFDQSDLYQQTIEVLSVCGACMGIKRALLPQLGLFDETYFHYFEETDYCYNARFHGYQVIYCPDSKVIHYGQGSCHNRDKLNQYYRHGQAYFAQKWAEFLKDPAEYG